MSDRITQKVVEALETGQYVSTASLASWIGCGKDKIIDAYEEIEGAGIKMMRVRGIGGGAQFLGKQKRAA